MSQKLSDTQLPKMVQQDLPGHTRDYLPQADLGAAFAGIENDGRFRIHLPSDAPNVETECIYFGGNLNFGHFLFQNLLRLALLKWLPEVNGLPIAVYGELPRRYLEFLDLVGFPESRRIVIPIDRPTRFSKAWLLSSPMFRREGGAAMIWPEALWEIRTATAALSRPALGQRRRLYIGRGSSKYRRLVNERELAPILASHGFETVDLSAMSAVDQVATVTAAEIIITAMGAASQITMFSPPDCIQLQLTPPDFMATFGTVATAAILGQPYGRIYGRVASPEEVAAARLPRNEGDKIIDADFHIEPGLLAAMLPQFDRHCRRATPS